jgi:hypothetical protein
MTFINLNRYLGTFIGTFDFIDISTIQGVNWVELFSLKDTLEW